MSCKESALYYLRHFGWQTLALCPSDHSGVGSKHRSSCCSPGKAAISRWSHLNTQKQDARALEYDFGRLPSANVGVLLGEISNIFSLDIDSQDAYEEIRLIAGDYSLSTPFVYTTSRGLQALYSRPSPPLLGPLRNGEMTIAGGRVDLLVEKKLAVLPPSRHKSGAVYAWCKKQAVKGLPPVAPDWLLELCASRLKGSSSSSLGSSSYPEVGEIFYENQGRNNMLYRFACACRRHGLTREEIEECLSVVSDARCVPPLGEAEIANIAKSASRHKMGFDNACTPR